jgi:hypothetical protein
MSRPSSLKGGTAIAAIWTPDEVVIAADSADNEIRQGEMWTVDSACKIRVYGKFVFAVKGIRCGEPDFDVHSIVEQILRQDKSLAEAVRCLTELLPAPLREVADQLRKTDRQAFDLAFQRLPLEVIVATNEGGNPQMGSVRVVVEHSEPDFSMAIEGHHCPADAGGCAILPLLLPPSTVSQLEYQEQYPEIDPGDLVSYARAFVQFMIDREEPGVGPPIDVLQITRLGRRWVQCKPGCDAIG